MSSYTYYNITTAWEVELHITPFDLWPYHDTYEVHHDGVTEAIDLEGFETEGQACAAMMIELRRQIDILAAQEELKLRKWNELSKAEQKAAASDADYLLAEFHNPY